MPVMPTRSSKALATLTASWPVRLSATSSVSCGRAMSRTLTRDFAHQLFVDVDAAGGIEQHDVVAAEARSFERALGDLLRRLAGNDRQRVDAGLLAEHAQLLLCSRAPRVERRHQHFLLVAVGEPLGDLRRRRRLAGALQADHHHGDGRGGVQIDGGAVRAEHGDELVVDDLDDHLAWRDRAQNLLADRLGLHLVDEVAHHIERDVRLEQGAAHLAHRLADVALGQRAATRQLVENAGQAI